jgi:hypothetical protein
MLAALPGAVDAAAVLDRPADLLLTDPAGRAARMLVARTGLFTQTQRAWAGLSEALGYTQEEATRALLGRRVVVAWAGLTGDASDPDGASGPIGPVRAFGAAARADTRWLVIAEIDRATADAVRTRLRPAPRRTLDGRVIYSIDAGRTAMALLDHDTNTPDAVALTRVLIAPVQGVGLLETVLAATADRPADASNPLGARARTLLGATRPGWAAIAAIRPPGSADPSVIEFRTAGPAWGIRFAAPSDQAMTNGAPIGVLAHVADDALLAAAFAKGPRFGPGGLDLRFNLDARPNNDDVDDGRDDPAGSGGAPLDLRHGTVVALLRAAPVPDDSGALGVPGVSEVPAMIGQVITHAAIIDGTPFAERTDRLISDMIGGENPPTHRGRFPDAVRTHTIEPQSKGSDAAEADWPGDHARVAWAVGPDPVEPNGPAQADPAQPGPTAGVLSMAFGPRRTDPAQAARAGRDAWTAGRADTDPSMLAAGRARPAELIAMLNPPTSSPLLTMAASIARIEWTVRLRDGLARGEILILIQDHPTRLGSP